MSEYFLIAEDHDLVNMGYKILFEIYFPNYRFETAYSTVELEHYLNTKGNEFTFALWDLQLNDGNVLAMINETIRRFPGLYILIVTSSPEEIYAAQLYKSGIRGYLSKDARKDELIHAIKTIVAGNIYFTKTFKQLKNSGHFEGVSADNPFSLLSMRELDILKHLLSGKRIKDISALTGLKQSTIATYKQRLLDKLNAKSIMALHQLASIHNII